MAQEAYRSQIKTIVKEASDFLYRPDTQLHTASNLCLLEEELSVYVQRLTATLDDLITEDKRKKKEIGNKVTFDDYSYTVKIAKFQDDAISVLARLRTRIKQVQWRLYSTSAASPPPMASATNGESLVSTGSIFDYPPYNTKNEVY